MGTLIDMVVSFFESIIDAVFGIFGGGGGKD